MSRNKTKDHISIIKTSMHSQESRPRSSRQGKDMPLGIFSLSLGILGLLFLILAPGFRDFSFAQKEFVYNAKGKRDPFIPLVTTDGRLLNLEQKEEVSDLSLEGIIYDPSTVSYVIVNGEVLKAGDKIGDYEVKKIEKNKAIFLKNGEPVEVKLKGEEE